MACKNPYICGNRSSFVRKSNLHIFKAVLLAIALSPLLFSCKSTKLLNDGEYLLIKNSISLNEKNPGIRSDELYSLARPKPNKKFLGLARIKLNLYYRGTHGKPESRYRTWLRDKAGERPSVYDSAASLASARDMEFYLNKVGYFYSTVYPSVKKTGKKKIKVTYHVDPSLPYRIRSIHYVIEDSLMAGFIRKSRLDPKIRQGEVYNAFKLDDERDRITEILMNNGYYYFNRDFVFFEIDSTGNQKEMDVKVKIRPNKMTSPDDPMTFVYRPHKRYFIHNIYIRPNFDPILSPTLKYDTLKFTVEYGRAVKSFSDYYILHTGDIKVRPSTVSQSVFIKQGDPFRLNDVKRSRSRINELGLFSYNSIKFKEIPTPDTAANGLLDCNLDLSRKKLHAFTVETEVTNSGGRPGVGLNFTYQNSNVFGGAEILRLKARVALEAQQIFGTDAEYSEATPFFNTIETGLQVGVDFPRFLIPIKQERFPKYFRPKTTVSVGFGFENRPEYERWVTNFTFGYDWKESEQKRHQVFPFDWSLVNVTLSPDFQEQIENEPNDRIKNQYTDNLIMGPRYAFTYSTQDIRKIQNFIYFRSNVQTAGNILQLGYKLADPPKDSLGMYQVWGIEYAQFFKIDGDFRMFNVISKNTSLAYRLFFGIALPFGNSEVMPLETGYYGGGSNGMRGWPFRLLGPGSYSNPDDYYDKMGDLQIEGNIEYRFPVYSFFKSAIFADIGNIWILNDNETYPGGEFAFERFYKEFAIDAGIGLRFDFNFFILRVDVAIPFRDPSQPVKERWVMNDWQLNDIIINFGIGYPF